MSGSRFNPTTPARGPAPADARAERAERLVDAVLGAVVHRDVVVPRTQVKGRMRLLTRAEESLVRSEVRRELADVHKISASAPGLLEAYPEWREERILRVLAIAVRDPESVERPLATIEEWATCDDQQLLALWDAYQDLEAELDPLGPSAPPPSAEEVAELVAAAKKGELGLLMSFGSRRLAHFARSSVAAPSS